MLGREHRKFLKEAGIPPRTRSSVKPQEEPKPEVDEAARHKRKAADLREQAKSIVDEARERAADIMRAAEKRANDLIADAQRHEAAARPFEASGLPRKNLVRTLSRMEAVRTEDDAQASGRAGRTVESDHPFPRAVIAKGLKVADWARSHGLDVSRVQSWYRDVQRRKIPREWALVIEQELGVPATTGPGGTWPDGFKRERDQKPRRRS